MKIDASDMLNSILESLSRIDYIHADEIPNIDLYMDQITTFMDAQLEASKRYAEVNREVCVACGTCAFICPILAVIWPTTRQNPRNPPGRPDFRPARYGLRPGTAVHSAGP